MNKCTVCDETTLGHRCRGCGNVQCESYIFPKSIKNTDIKWFDTKFETLGEDKLHERPNTQSVDERTQSSHTSEDEPQRCRVLSSY